MCPDLRGVGAQMGVLRPIYKFGGFGAMEFLFDLEGRLTFGASGGTRQPWLRGLACRGQSTAADGERRAPPKLLGVCETPGTLRDGIFDPPGGRALAAGLT